MGQNGRASVLKKKQDDFILTAIIDTREQTPFDLEKHGLKTVREALLFGDYSLANPDLRNYLTIERKNIDDLAQCVGKERNRFEKELLALRGYQRKLVICECTLYDIIMHAYRSKIKPFSVIASIGKWESWGIGFIFADSAEVASYFAACYMRAVAKEFVSFAKSKVNFKKE